MIILLMVIDGYSISGYCSLLMAIILMTIGGYRWLLMVIILMPIGGYYITGCFWIYC